MVITVDQYMVKTVDNMVKTVDIWLKTVDIYGKYSRLISGEGY